MHILQASCLTTNSFSLCILIPTTYCSSTRNAPSKSAIVCARDSSHFVLSNAQMNPKKKYVSHPTYSSPTQSQPHPCHKSYNSSFYLYSYCTVVTKSLYHDTRKAISCYVTLSYGTKERKNRYIPHPDLRFSLLYPPSPLVPIDILLPTPAEKPREKLNKQNTTR